jgi:ABC-type multidrug transport system permease subunit
VPILWRAQQPGFTLRHIWFLSVATVGVQLLVSLLLLKREFRLRLSTPMAEPAAASA